MHMAVKALAKFVPTRAELQPQLAGTAPAERLCNSPMTMGHTMVVMAPLICFFGIALAWHRPYFSAAPLISDKTCCGLVHCQSLTAIFARIEATEPGSVQGVLQPKRSRVVSKSVSFFIPYPPEKCSTWNVAFALSHLVPVF